MSLTDKREIELDDRTIKKANYGDDWFWESDVHEAVFELTHRILALHLGLVKAHEDGLEINQDELEGSKTVCKCITSKIIPEVFGFEEQEAQQ